MALSKEYTSEQLNFFRICYVTTDVLADGLREIFKQEWDKVYKSTKGECKDDSRVEQTFITVSLLKIKKEMLFFWPL